MRKIVLGICLLAIVVGAAYWRGRSLRAPLTVAYSGERNVTLWSTTAQVRESMATLEYGDRLEVLGHDGSNVQVRTAKGTTGWMDSRLLLSVELWDQGNALLAKAREMPVEAHGHTKVVSNLRVEPGRDGARIRQLLREVPVGLVERRVVQVPTNPAAAKDDAGSSEESEAKQEDWWLVRAQPKDQSETAGWILGRFIDLDLPSPLPDYASTAGMRVVAWFALNHVTDPAGGPKPQYLVVGTHGPEGQPCDFSMLRVYTWSVKHRRYETAYVEGHLCAQLPVTVTPASSPGGDVFFRFKAAGRGGEEDAQYRMRQTIVRRVREGEPARRAKRHR
jgi:hypothetical protein